MKLNEFIKISSLEIKKAIDNFNNQNPQYKAFYPEHIEFDLSVMICDDEIKIVSVDEDCLKNVTQLKIKVPMADYKWIKE